MVWGAQVITPTGTKWSREALCYRTGTKLVLVPGLKQPVLNGGGRMHLFVVVTCGLTLHWHMHDRIIYWSDPRI